MINLTDKHILVTGSEGFLGHHLVPLLKAKAEIVSTIEHNEFELLSSDSVHEMFWQYRPDIIIHLAARVGGIHYNQANPATLFYENLQMGINLIHCCKECMYVKPDKFVCIGTVCSYPKIPERRPFREIDLWNGYPEETNAAYGIAKKSLLTMCQAYRQQYGMNCIFLIPTNMYGPEDSFTDSRAHVIPMLIKRFLKAKEDNLPEVEVWGSGNATREFIYAGDAAKVIVKAVEIYNKPEPLNIGTGQETSIVELANTIASIIDYKGKIVLNTSMPDGQPRRVLDISRMLTELEITDEFTSLKSGLKRTIEWYKENR